MDDRGGTRVRGGVGTRGGLGRIAAMAVGLAVVLLLAAAGEARGGLYRVAQCGWGVGAELDPTYPPTEGTAFSLDTASCAAAPGAPAGMKFEEGVAPAGAYGRARARWVAPAGTVFRGAHLTWSEEPQWGSWAALGFYVGNQFQLLPIGSVGAVPTALDLPVEGSAWAFEAWLSCAFTPPRAYLCDRSLPSTARLSRLTFTLEDAQAPRVQLGGAAVGAGWRRGTTTLELGATDVGAGIGVAEASVDGVPIARVEPACATAPIDGVWDGTKLQPCPATVARTVEVDTTRFADGSHTLVGCATDFAGERGCATAIEIEVDNSAPAVSFSDATEGEVATTVDDRFSGPATGAIAVRRAGADAWTDLPTTFEREGDGAARLSARLPEMGGVAYSIRATATDAAGNSGSGQLRVAASAAEPRHQASDGHGEKGASSSGDGPARRRRATHLEVRLVASGRAGARALLVGTGTGVVDRGADGSRAAGSGLTVDYGTTIEVRGRLTEGRGRGIGGRSVAIVVRAAAGIGAPSRHRVRTDAGGRFALPLPPGVSRRIAVAFRGGDGLAASRPRPLTLRVSAGVTLTAAPIELATGDSVRLRGRVRLGPAHVSGRGKLVTIQYLERATKRWRPALVVRTDAEGRFDSSYRFRYVTGVARIRLRATAPAEGGWPFARGSSLPVTVTVRSR